MTGKNLDELLSLGYLPTLYEMDIGRTISISEFRKLSHEEVDSLNAPVVIDGAQWVASDTKLIDGKPSETANVFSGNGVQVGKDIRRKKFTVFEVGDNGLESVDYYHLTKNKLKNEERGKMSDELNKLAGGAGGVAGMSNLSDLAASMAGSQPAAGQQPMNAFNTESGAAAAEAGGTPILKSEITSRIEKVQIADAHSLQLFNRKHGRLVGYVTNQEPKIDFVTTAEPRMENGKHVLLSNAPEIVNEQFVRGEKVAKKYLQTEYRLHVRQAKPGKILGLTLSIPEGGLVDLTAFRTAGKLTGDQTRTNLVYQILSKDLYPTFLDFYFGSKILEAPETHGGEAAGEVEQRASLRFKTESGKQTTTQVISRSLKPSKRKSLLWKSNFFPMKTYETIRIGGAPLTPEQIATLNESSFISLVNAKAVPGQTSNRFNLLATEDRSKVSREGNGTITSRFFTNDANNAIALEVRPFYSKEDEPLDILEVPVKEKKVNATSQAVTYRYVTYLTTDEKILADPELAKKTALGSGRYETIINAAHGALNAENLRELVRRASSKGKTATGLSNQDLIKLQLGLAENQVDAADIEFRDSSISDYAQLSKTIDEIRVEVGA
jgi:hypothetical protein